MHFSTRPRHKADAEGRTRICVSARIKERAARASSAVMQCVLLQNAHLRAVIGSVRSARLSVGLFLGATRCMHARGDVSDRAISPFGRGKLTRIT